MQITTGILAHLREDPFHNDQALEIITDGALAIDGLGKIVQAGSRADVLARWPSARIEDSRDCWLLPGLVDGHIHFPQFYATASGGEHLLDWLDRSVFPAELALAQPGFADRTATAFIHRMLASGTTTAMVFGSQFLHANQSLFDAAQSAGMRLIAGLTMMDQKAPKGLLLTPDQAYRDSETLLVRCAREPLLDYAVTPRFALSCSPAMLAVCQSLLQAYPDCYLQTHINENIEEIEAVGRQFPNAASYLDVYDAAGLLGPKTVLAHNIHATPAELDRLAQTHCSVCHCPSSNMFLGSGLFRLRAHLDRGIRVMMGTDVGAGTSFSIWHELGLSYKIQKLQRFTMSAAQLLYLGTLAGARALGLDHTTGNFAVGKSADFIVLDPNRDEYLTERLARCESHDDQLFVLLQLAGDRHLEQTVVAGKTVYSRPTGA